MAKKEVEKEEVYVEEVVTKVEPLTGEFGREDLNALRDKINEIIKHL